MMNVLERIPQLGEEATVIKFAELVGKDKSAISVHKSKGVLKGTSMLDWLHSYMDHLSAVAGGRGSDSERLTAARIDELESKAGLNRLTYYEKMGSLVLVDLARDSLSEWASYTSQEINAAFEKFSVEIESKYKIELDHEMRNDIAEAIIKRIKGFALKLGQSLGSSSDNINPS